LGEWYVEIKGSGMSTSGESYVEIWGSRMSIRGVVCRIGEWYVEIVKAIDFQVNFIKYRFKGYYNYFGGVVCRPQESGMSIFF